METTNRTETNEFSALPQGASNHDHRRHVGVYCTQFRYRQPADEVLASWQSNSRLSLFRVLGCADFWVWFCVVEGCGGLCGGDRWCGLCWWFRVGRGVGGLLARAAE